MTGAPALMNGLLAVSQPCESAPLNSIMHCPATMTGASIQVKGLLAMSQPMMQRRQTPSRMDKFLYCAVWVKVFEHVCREQSEDAGPSGPPQGAATVPMRRSTSIDGRASGSPGKPLTKPLTQVAKHSKPEPVQVPTPS